MQKPEYRGRLDSDCRSRRALLPSRFSTRDGPLPKLTRLILLLRPESPQDAVARLQLKHGEAAIAWYIVHLIRPISAAAPLVECYRRFSRQKPCPVAARLRYDRPSGRRLTAVIKSSIVIPGRQATSSNCRSRPSPNRITRDTDLSGRRWRVGATILAIGRSSTPTVASIRGRQSMPTSTMVSNSGSRHQTLPDRSARRGRRWLRRRLDVFRIVHSIVNISATSQGQAPQRNAPNWPASDAAA